MLGTVPDTPGLGVVVTSTGLVLPVRRVRDDGYLVGTTCANEAVVEFGTHAPHVDVLSDPDDGGRDTGAAGANGLVFATHVPRVDVLLDPGHGGRDTGAVGANGLVERDLNLAIAQLVRAGLEEQGYSVLLTRNTNVEMPIVTRTEIALALSPDVLVSIHHNGGATRRSRDPGTEVFHRARSAESRRLGGLLFEEVHAAMSQYDVAWTATSNKGTLGILRTRDNLDLFGILRLSEGVTAAIVEAAYLSNPPEAELLTDPAVQQVEAEAIAAGIVRYLTTEDPGSGHKSVVTSGRITTSGRRSGCVDPA